MLAAETSPLGKSLRDAHAIPAQYDPSLADPPGNQSASFLLGRRHDRRRPGQQGFAKKRVVDPLHPQAPHDRQEHPDRLDHVRNAPLAAKGGNRGPQQIVQTKNVRDIEIPQTRAAESLHGGIPARRPVVKPRRQVNGRRSPRVAPPSERAPFRWSRAQFREPLLHSPVRRQHRHLVPSSSHPLRKRPHFDRRPAELVKWHIGFRNLQDAHSSRRIFLNDFANALNRKSRSTRSRPLRPISCATVGFSSSASMDVARCTASPCGTRYPVTPSSITSGAPPCAPPITGLP